MLIMFGLFCVLIFVNLHNITCFAVITHSCGFIWLYYRVSMCCCVALLFDVAIVPFSFFSFASSVVCAVNL